MKKMQKIIISIFAPFFIAVIVKIVLVILGAFLYYVGGLFGFSKSLAANIANFDTFTWDESYVFWIIVGALTFHIEMLIWDEDNK